MRSCVWGDARGLARGLAEHGRGKGAMGDGQSTRGSGRRVEGSGRGTEGGRRGPKQGLGEYISPRLHDLTGTGESAARGIFRPLVTVVNLGKLLFWACREGCEGVYRIWTPPGDTVQDLYTPQ